MTLPSIENLQCFDAAARADSFRSAAKAVALTPAAFSQRIKQLEEQLGVQLFHRTTRALSLTEAGQALVPRVREMLDLLSRLPEAAREGGAPVELTVGTRYELALSWVIPLDRLVTGAIPHLSLHYFIGGSGSELHGRVKDREIDACITSHRITDPLLEGLRIHREEYVFVATPALLEKTPFQTDADAQRHTLIDIDASLPLFGYWRDSPGGGDRLQFSGVLRAGSIEPMRRFVLDGRGVAVLPLYFVQPDLDEGRLARLLPEVTPLFDYFRLVFRRDDPRRGLMTTLAETYAQHPLQ